MPSLSVMLKPASADCNLLCDYCFYREEANARSAFSTGRMTAETARTLAERALRLARGGVLTFTIQGGEPLLAGHAFFEGFFAAVERLRDPETTVFLCVQTNGTLLDDRYCALFKQYGVLVGLSLDGTKRTNLHRIFPDGKNAYPEILAGAELLKKHGVEFNIVAVVTPEVAVRADEIYRELKSRGFRYLQFIPCLSPMKPDSDPGSAPGFRSYAPSSAEYARFLKALFDRYERDFYAGDAVSVRQFDNYVRLAAGGPAEQCGMGGLCSEQYAVEADGSVYPCDFYCTDKYLLGNILRDDFPALRAASRRIFLSERTPVKPGCKNCRYYFLCRGGGCKRAAETDYCNAYRAFFSYAAERIVRIAARLKTPV